MSTFSYSVYDDRAREMVADPEKYKAKAKRESLAAALKERQSRRIRVTVVSKTKRSA